MGAILRRIYAPLLMQRIPGDRDRRDGDADDVLCQFRPHKHRGRDWQSNCNRTLQHIANPAAAIAEMARVVHEVFDLVQTAHATVAAGIASQAAVED